MTTIFLLGAITCLLAVAMAVHSGFALYRAEKAGHQGQAYVLPVFVGMAYVVLTALELHDAAITGIGRRVVVGVVAQLVQTMLIVSVILMVHRLRRRGD